MPASGYSFYLIREDANPEFLVIKNLGLPDAMYHAVNLAFQQKRNAIRGVFVAIKDGGGREVFRTPVPKI